MIIIEKDENLVIPVGINPNISTSNDTKLQSKTVDSSTAHQSVTPDSGYDGLSSVEVNPYTVERKERMITENGPYEFAPSNADALSSVSIEVSVDTRIEQERTVDSSTETQIVEPEAPYNCLSKVTVNPYVLDSSSAVIEQNGNYVFSPVHDGLSSVTVDVSIDSRVAQSKTVDSSTANQTVVPDEGYNALTSVTVNGLDLDPIYNLADSI